MYICLLKWFLENFIEMANNGNSGKAYLFFVTTSAICFVKLYCKCGKFMNLAFSYIKLIYKVEILKILKSFHM